MGDVETKLRQCFVTALLISESTEVAELTYKSIPEWDSVAHMSLIAEIDSAFGIMLDTDDVLALNSFSAAEQIVHRYINEP